MTHRFRITISMALAAAWLLSPLGVWGKESIVNSKHNLSASGPDPVGGEHYPGLCSFCHVPHGATQPQLLWARPDSAAVYQPYQSETIRAAVGQPTGASKRCLSCHDGTLALIPDSHRAVARQAQSGRRMDPLSPANLGTNLTDDHPISFSYAESYSALRQAQGGPAQGDLADPAALQGAVRLDRDGYVQCTSCHDPHDDSYGHFLVQPNSGGALCQVCHTIAGYLGSAHQLVSLPGSARLDLRPSAPRGDDSLQDRQGCNACHVAHNAASRAYLLVAEEAGAPNGGLCLACHDGRTARHDIGRSLRKPYAHPVGVVRGAHSPGERPPLADGHVECGDCHNPHRANDRPAIAGTDAPAGSLDGVSGMGLSGEYLSEAAREYEICFKCHATDAELGFNHIARQVNTSDARRQFDPSAASYHPVVAPAQNPGAPSLRRGLSAGTRIACSDCHGDDESRALGGLESPLFVGGGAGPRGPHGSRYRHILAAEYRTGDRVTEGPQAYALCYGCHDRTSILNDESFARHRQHIVDGRASCSICHDAHGVPSGEDDPSLHRYLINFDVSIVQPEVRSGRIEFVSTGPGAGFCNLNCHGVNHEHETYQNR